MKIKFTDDFKGFAKEMEEFGLPYDKKFMEGTYEVIRKENDGTVYFFDSEEELELSLPKDGYVVVDDYNES